MRKNYNEEAYKLARAIDIAIEAIKKYPPSGFTVQDIEQFIKSYEEFKQNALNPKAEFKKITSLNYIIQDVLTYFQEGHGKAVEYFWEKINANQIDYKRENILSKILKKNRIKNQIEYEYTIDTIVPYEQQGLINKEQVAHLSSLIEQFENKR